MTRLAKLYGLSNVGLAKICKKHDIPKPYPGYWAQRRVGQNPRKVKLPDPEREEEIKLVELSEPEIAASDKLEASTKAATEAAPRIVIAETLRGAHRLVSETNEQLQGVKASDAGLLIPPANPSLKVSVSRGSLRRTLLIIDAILKHCEQRGFVVHRGPQVQIDNQKLGFEISEQSEVVREQVDETNLEGRYEFHHNRFRETSRPTGKLTLHISEGGACWSRNVRHTWRETEKQRIEDCLKPFMASLVTMAAKKKEYEEAQEQQRRAALEAQRKKQEEAIRRAERRKLQKAEQQQVNSLLEYAKYWRESQNLRAFIEARTHLYIQINGPVAPDSDFARWQVWATQQADRLDPLIVSPPSILDEDLGPDEPTPPHWSWQNR